MKEFMMIFRSEINESFGPSPEQMQSSIQHWMDWMGGIAAQGKMASGNRLSFEGKTLKPNNVIADGPYAEVKEIIGGYVVVKATNIDEAMKLAEGCPILNHGGHVEVRSVISINS
ncbi:YciI family protein [Flavobacterium sp.]|uniref:YciI family protein n=1 Tax=Flavobacterium sp. TaxID=239 RepID=UPI00286D2569|nr:YciI family protein [Flavobacterium sp.]